ncbi:PepSY domain-containing protein [Paracoccus ravus]|uniref:PepSY domain-containing protein n=1 Tax=Paracoccus ravus TaxID=2447760 RepID=UPI00106EA2FC|nr:PepSY domain-containing protein [Paracoccus ravus]
MRKFLILTVAVLTAAPALAADRCDVDKAKWRPVEELKAELASKGWTVSNVKEEDGCYEVYGKDASGKRVEIFFDPATFEEKGSDD